MSESQWVDIDVGLGFTSIYNTGFVGISTNDPRFTLQIGGNSTLGSFQNGVGINSAGGIVATGVVTATTFKGNLEGSVTGDITGIVTASKLNATGISTFNDDVEFHGAPGSIPPILWDSSQGALEFRQDTKATFGNTRQFQIVQDSQYSKITSTATELRL